MGWLDDSGTGKLVTRPATSGGGVKLCDSGDDCLGVGLGITMGILGLWALLTLGLAGGWGLVEGWGFAGRTGFAATDGLGRGGGLGLGPFDRG